MILSKGKNKGRIRKGEEREDIGNHARKKVLKFDIMRTSGGIHQYVYFIVKFHKGRCG